jgi:hypothetical protein
MSYVAPDVLIKTSSPDYVGGIYALRLAYSSDVKTQRFQTDSEIISPLQFLNGEKWVTGWYWKFLQALLTIEEFQNEDGITEDYQFGAYLDSFCTEEIFRAWWTKYLKGRSFCAELTDMNGFVRILNPFRITYKYVGTRDYSESNRYELIFKRVKVIDFPKNLTDCQPTVLSITELLLPLGELESDWEDIETVEENLENPLESDWEDILTNGNANCVATLLTVTELLIQVDEDLEVSWEDIITSDVSTDPQEIDWEDIATVVGAFSAGFSNGFN